jgi:hypothetical protein
VLRASGNIGIWRRGTAPFLFLVLVEFVVGFGVCCSDINAVERLKLCQSCLIAGRREVGFRGEADFEN